MSNSTTNIVTRFAPSPTGFLHIGGARTALFNWLYAKHNNGKFLLRIEDTDKARSSSEAIEAIIGGLKWLGLNHDDSIVHQSHNIKRHQEIAQQLLTEDKAYYCYCSADELSQMREEALTKGQTARYNGKWRDNKDTPPTNVKPVIRIKAPINGNSKINDQVQGEISVHNDTIDDFIIVRADGTPTYMLSVVVDDHDMGITTIIRGDDHLTNAFRQKVIYDLLGWQMPTLSHIPLIHGPDGAKLSKRHGSLGLNHYQESGFLAEALCNYLLRLGWSHGNDEIISTAQAIEWFTLQNVGKSPSRFDINKLTNLNSYYLRHYDNGTLYELIENDIQKLLQRDLSPQEKNNILQGLNGIKERSKTLIELAEQTLIYTNSTQIPYDEKAIKFINNEQLAIFHTVKRGLSDLDNWQLPTIEELFRNIATEMDIKLGKIAQPIRAALTGSIVSPSIFEIIFIIGTTEAIKRIDYAINQLKK